MARNAQQSLLVTGGAGSLGIAVACLFTEMGWDVTAVDVLPRPPQLERTKFYQADLSNAVECMRIVREYGPFASVVYCAGVNYMTPTHGVQLARTLRSEVDVNIIGPVLCAQTWMRQRGVVGSPQHFVMVGSNSAQIARTNSLGYCATKAAVAMAMRVFAREWADTDLSFWTVEPGLIENSNMTRRVQDKLKGKPLHRIPGDRTLKVQELAQYIYNAVSNDHRWLNGTSIRLDGGEQ